MSSDKHSKKDNLVSSERAIQKGWYEAKVFQPEPKPGQEKYMVTFPYPYQNGTLHLGHTYTITKAEFMARYQRAKGKNVLFPFAFHGTGMPIVACAKRLAAELESGEDIENCKQTSILLKMGINRSELGDFTDPYHWLIYFPDRSIKDLTRLGVSADFSRSFTTTDMNPYYDSFIKWQFNELNKKGLLINGLKPVIYSPADGQPCAAHDLDEKSEDVGIKEYTLIRLKVADTETDNLYLLAATTRPETMYAMTNVWVDPEQKYTMFSFEGGTDVMVCRSETVRNLKYQIDQKIIIITNNISGKDLVGKTVNFYLANREEIPVIGLQLDQNKGSGIVVSVPGHSAFDYKHYQKWGEVDENDCVINTNKGLTVNIIKDGFSKKKTNIDEIASKIFKIENDSGYMTKGIYAGKQCTYARDLVKSDLIMDGLAYGYYEPDGVAITRSGDRCVVSVTEQWFLNYGDSNLKAAVKPYLENEFYVEDKHVKKGLIKASDWIDQWPCSRSTGLGTKLLDTEYLIDSLSDSTIYMAYYTIANYVNKIPTQILTDSVWEYLFKDGKMPAHMRSTEFEPILKQMRQEFDYWYPMDLRVSGKDLIGNHLVMCLYNHSAIWPDKSKWPRSFYANGHLQINGEKMSKHTGNFITLSDALDQFGADATRLALADAGNSLGDANFTTENADNAVLKLTSEKAWCQETIDAISNATPMEFNIWDLIFVNEIKWNIRETTRDFDEMNYQRAVKSGFYDMMSTRDQYRKKYETGIINMNPSAMKFYIETHLALIYPICPHYSESLWNYAEERGIQFNHSWPSAEDLSMKLIWQKQGFDDVLSRCWGTRKSIIKRCQKNSKLADVDNLKLEVVVYTSYSNMQRNIVEDINEHLRKGLSWNDIMRIIMSTVKDNKLKGKYGSFIKYCQNMVEKYGIEWIEWVLHPREECSMIRTWIPKSIEFTEYSFTEEPEPEYDFKYGPWEPKITVS